MERDWVRLGTALASARKHVDVTQVAMGERIGVSRGPVQAIERGDVSRITTTIRAYAREVGWADGSIERVLGGRDPIIAEPLSDSSAQGPDNPNVENGPAYARGMPSRVTVTISDGEVYDTDIIDLSASESSAPLVMIAKDLPADATDEERRAYVRTWTRIQREVRRIVDDERSNP